MEFLSPRQQLVLDLSRQAGAMALVGFNEIIMAENKAVSGFDPVTAFDLEIEQFLRNQIAGHFAEDAIVGEEFGVEEGQSGYRWILDPIDGTRAYVVGSPVWSVLIGLMQADKMIFGAAYFPVSDQLFYGDGHGAWLMQNSSLQPLKTSACQALNRATLGATTPDMFEGQNLISFDALKSACKTTRYGMDSLAWCQLAAGRIDLVCEADLKAVDFLPLLPLLTGAGAMVSNWTGQPPGIHDDAILAAATNTLHQAALERLNQ